MVMSSLAVDIDRFENGAVLMLSETCGARLRSVSSEEAQKVRERLYEPYSGFREIPPAINQRIVCDYIAQGLVVEWIGPWADCDDKPLDTSDWQAMSKALQDKRAKVTRDRLFGFAANEKTYQDHRDAEAEKNSEPGPNGGSGGAKTQKASA